MPVKNRDLHGSAPDKSEIALVLIDVINDLDFPEADELLPYARPMARKILRLKQRAKNAGVPVIYVNDNFGRWRSDFRRQWSIALGTSLAATRSSRCFSRRTTITSC